MDDTSRSVWFKLRIFWLHFCTTAGSGDASCIIVYVNSHSLIKFRHQNYLVSFRRKKTLWCLNIFCPWQHLCGTNLVKMNIFHLENKQWSFFITYLIFRHWVSQSSALTTWQEISSLQCYQVDYKFDIGVAVSHILRMCLFNMINISESGLFSSRREKNSWQQKQTLEESRAPARTVLPSRQRVMATFAHNE